jgi:hypothetical protein
MKIEERITTIEIWKYKKICRSRESGKLLVAESLLANLAQ